VFFLLTIVAAVGLSGAASGADVRSSDLPDSPDISTFAGTGGLGIADGPGDAATFVSPSGLSFGRDGTLFVADRDAQRIRSVSPNGNVRTIAGSGQLVPIGLGVPGGFRDGPALNAQFDMPSAVLAMDDGSVLVADANNLCIRRIRDAAVSTFAGDRVRGSRDGEGIVAEFSRPVALAKDTLGNAYVADPPNGIRKIEPSGRVTTLHFPGANWIVAVASIPGEPDSILIASVTRVERLNLKTLALDLPFPLELTYDYDAPYGEAVDHEGASYFGPVAALAAFRSDDFVFADAFASTVRFAQTESAGPTLWNYSRVLTAVPAEDATLGGGGFNDGPGAQARFNQPTGIAISRTGLIAVADTGNRRVRLLSRFNHHTHLEAHDLGTELPTKPNPHEFRIALVGTSVVWWNQSWHQSIPGMTQDRLSNKVGTDRRAVLYPIMRPGIQSLAALDYIDNELAEGTVDMVVLDLSTYGQMGGDGHAGPAFPPGWQDGLTNALTRTMKTLNSAGIAFLVINHPGASDFPAESEYLHVYKGGDATAYPNEALNVQTFHDQIAKALAASNVPTLDLWPAFLDAYRATRRVSLFNTWDYHLSASGRQIVADALTERLIEMKPWIKRGGGTQK